MKASGEHPIALGQHCTSPLQGAQALRFQWVLRAGATGRHASFLWGPSWGTLQQGQAPVAAWTAGYVRFPAAPSRLPMVLDPDARGPAKSMPADLCSTANMIATECLQEAVGIWRVVLYALGAGQRDGLLWGDHLHQLAMGPSSPSSLWPRRHQPRQVSLPPFPSNISCGPLHISLSQRKSRCWDL